MTPRELLIAYAGSLNPRAMPPFQILEAAAPKAFEALYAVLDKCDELNEAPGVDWTAGDVSNLFTDLISSALEAS